MPKKLMVTTFSVKRWRDKMKCGRMIVSNLTLLSRSERKVLLMNWFRNGRLRLLAKYRQTRLWQKKARTRNAAKNPTGNLFRLLTILAHSSRLLVSLRTGSGQRKIIPLTLRMTFQQCWTEVFSFAKSCCILGKIHRAYLSKIKMERYSILKSNKLTS